VSRRFLAVLAVLAATGLCGCGAEAPAAPPPPATTAATVFGGTDRAWIEINIAMNDELVPLLDLAPAHSRDNGIKALAAQVKSMNEREGQALRDLHTAAGLPAENPHKGMPMPGMVTPEIVAAAAASEGPAFDRTFREHVRAHYEQGVRLAESETKAGVEPRTKELATTMLADRRSFLPKFT
jgi:uncharacterized protein (DUF305 family)